MAAKVKRSQGDPVLTCQLCHKPVTVLVWLDSGQWCLDCAIKAGELPPYAPAGAGSPA